MAQDAAQACEWVYQTDPDYYETSCQHAYCLTAGTLEENEHRYCPYCGGKIVEANREH